MSNIQKTNTRPKAINHTSQKMKFSIKDFFNFGAVPTQGYNAQARRVGM